MNFPKPDRKRGGRISMGKFTPERERTIEWQGWLLDNDISREKQNEIAEMYPDMIERLEYIKTLCIQCLEETETPGEECLRCHKSAVGPTFHDKVKHYEKVMTSPTAKFELPE